MRELSASSVVILSATPALAHIPLIEAAPVRRLCVLQALLQAFTVDLRGHGLGLGHCQHRDIR